MALHAYPTSKGIIIKDTRSGEVLDEFYYKNRTVAQQFRMSGWAGVTTLVLDGSEKIQQGNRPL